MRFAHFKQTPRTRGDHLAKIDLLRRDAGSRMKAGGPSPEDVASVLSLRHVSPYKANKSLVLASAHGDLGITGIPQQMRRMSGPTCGCGRRDVLYAADGEERRQSSSEGDFATWLAYCQA